MTRHRIATFTFMLLLGLQLCASVNTPVEHHRPAVNTYLTFPEWFLVFSPAEYADYVKHDTPSNFPFVGHVRQFWQSYAAVTNETIDQHMEFNGGYHVMIMVIGISTTVEYGIRSAYETIVGRLSELTMSTPTAEDQFAAAVAQQYVDFIRVHPWYEFDFWSRLKQLWSLPSTEGSAIRKWERRYALTTEYLVKAGYGWLIGVGTHTSYDAPLPETAVVVRDANGQERLQMLPRYEAFMAAAMTLATERNEFVEIAGNDAKATIVISVLTDASVPDLEQSRLLFSQPIITQPGYQRKVFAVSVGSLSGNLRILAASNNKIEHVFDY